MSRTGFDEGPSSSWLRVRQTGSRISSICVAAAQLQDLLEALLSAPREGEDG